MTWRDDANRVIQNAIDEIGDDFIVQDDIDELFKNISRKLYPFGERKYWPYKVWLSAIAKNREACKKRICSEPQEPINYKTGLFEDVQ